MASGSLILALRARTARVLMDTVWKTLAESRRLPWANPARYGIERIRDIPYKSTGLVRHRLDVYRPKPKVGAPSSTAPVVLYFHGGGFRILSKDTHWIMGLQFARRGYVVLNVNYGLAPQHPFPGGLEDCCAALLWAKENARELGGDGSRIVLAGESAGANLALSLAIATSYERPEPWAKAVFDSGVRPLAILPACGLLEVSDVDRFARRGLTSRFVQGRLAEIEATYRPRPRGEREDLADPLVMLERGEKPMRPLPPCFAGVGTGDVLEDDTVRLKRALDALGAECVARYYDGEPHAFNALIWREQAKAFWRDTFTFLDEHAPVARP